MAMSETSKTFRKDFKSLSVCSSHGSLESARVHRRRIDLAELHAFGLGAEEVDVDVVAVRIAHIDLHAAAALHPAAVIGHLLSFQTYQEVLETDGVEGEVLKLQHALLRRQLLHAHQVDDSVVAAVNPGTGERERRPE